MKRAIFYTISSVIIISLIIAFIASSKETPTYNVNVINTYPHDEEAFTQGLVYEDGILYESTGLYGESTLRKVDLETGEVLETIPLSEEDFGEGLTARGDTLIQLTWESKRGYIYDKETLEKIDAFLYPIQGWGLTHNGPYLIMSDGSSTLYFLNPTNYTYAYTLEVTDQGEPVSGLNELEYIDGKIYANAWPTNKIAIIDPETGKVTQWINLEGLGPDDSSAMNVLNGIAYDEEQDRLFITGKKWPNLYEIELIY